MRVFDTLDREVLPPIVVEPRAPGEVALTVRGLAGQTAALQEWRDSAGSVMASVGAGREFHVYKTFTSPTNFERIETFWDGNTATITTRKGSLGGAARPIALVPNYDDYTVDLTLTPFGDATRPLGVIAMTTGPGLIAVGDPAIIGEVGAAARWAMIQAEAGAPVFVTNSATAPPLSATLAMLLLRNKLVGGSASGTFVGANAAVGYAGDFLNFQVNGVTKFKVDNVGSVYIGAADVILSREAAAILALRDGTNRQTLKVYTTASGGDFQFLSLGGTTGDTVEVRAKRTGVLTPQPGVFLSGSEAAFPDGGAIFGAAGQFTFRGDSLGTAAHINLRTIAAGAIGALNWLDSAGANQWAWLGDSSNLFVRRSGQELMVFGTDLIQFRKQATQARAFYLDTATPALSLAADVSNASNLLQLNKAPVADAAAALLTLGTVNLSGGSANGTFIGANPAAFTGDFIHCQIAAASKFKVTNAGSIVAAAIVDISAIAAGSPGLKITATSDAVTADPTVQVPAGWLEILVGADPRYVPFYSLTGA